MVGFDIREVKVDDYLDISKINSKIKEGTIKLVKEDNNHLMIVGQLNDEVVGYLKGRIDFEKKIMFIEGFSVDEKYKGLGIGYQLLLETEKELNNKSIESLIHLNKDYDEDEIKFFDRQGFVLGKGLNYEKVSILQ
ncbi:GNAT family N-acetyltransferase [Clostridium sp.]|uniref:GNAT family N-acetyltransferase n=1 Tax=Clostridium sp. TaxID=1506 RepID=UPI0026376654|nr:GNAT family N-acetyltransferase [Clostridium sp.]